MRKPSFARAVTLAFLGCGISGCSDDAASSWDLDEEPHEVAAEPHEFVPGMYSSTIVEVESDCQPALDDIFAATGLPTNALATVLWRYESPEFLFFLTAPRLREMLQVNATNPEKHFEPTEPMSALEFLPGEPIVTQFHLSWSLGCAVSRVVPTKEVRITQGEVGEFFTEIITQWPDFDFSFCQPTEVLPRSGCTERYRMRHELLRECPLNCTAAHSARQFEERDFFPSIPGDSRIETRPEAQFQCGPESPEYGPFLKGECPEEFIVP